MTEKELIEFLKKHDIIVAKTRTELKKLKKLLEEYRKIHSPQPPTQL